MKPGDILPDGRVMVEYGAYCARHLGIPSETKLAEIRQLVHVHFEMTRREHPEYGLSDYAFYERDSQMPPGVRVYGWLAMAPKERHSNRKV